jgi:hypothetical protein
VFYCFLSIAIYSSAQTYQIQQTSRQKMKLREFSQGIIASSSESVYTLRGKYNALAEQFVFIDQHNHITGQLTQAIPLVYPQLHKDHNINSILYFEDIIFTDSVFILLVSGYDYEKKSFISYAQIISPEGEKSNLFEALKITQSKKITKGEFVFKSSPNHQHFLIYHRKESLFNEEEIITISTFNSSMSLNWKTEYTLPGNGDRFNPEHLLIDNDGNVRIVSQIFLTDAQQKEKNLPEANFYYSVLTFYNNSEKNEPEEFILSFTDKYPVNIIAQLDYQSALTIAGYYSDKKTQEKINGLYFFQIPNNQSAPAKISVQRFQESFIPDFEKEKFFLSGTPEDPEVKNLIFHQLDDSSFILASEHTLISENCYTDFRTALTNCDYQYYFNDIFVVKIDIGGNIRWKLKIPKKQVSKNDYGLYSSFTFSAYHDRLVFFYNESEKNLDKKKDSGMKYMSDPFTSNIVAVEINSNGLVNKIPILSNAKQKTVFRPRFSMQDKGNGTFLYFSKFNSYAIRPVNTGF